MGLLEGGGVKRHPRNLLDTKQALREEIHTSLFSIPQAVLDKVPQSFRLSLQQCIDSQPHHLTDIIFKTKSWNNLKKETYLCLKLGTREVIMLHLVHYTYEV